MKTLLLVRHAKSSWDNPDWTDLMRPLNSRGLREAAMMANIISEKIASPDVILTSPAIRALATANIFVEQLDYSKDKLIVDINIYERGTNYVKKIVLSADDSIDFIMVFGHNPDITSLSSYFSGAYIDNVPTCGAVCIDFNVNKWQEIEETNGDLRFFDYPKKYKEK